MIAWRRPIEWLRQGEQRWRRLGLLMLGLGLTFVLVLISWVGTCGFYGCPSTAQIQAFRPSEGSRVLDRSGKPIGRLTYVRRINVSVNSVPRSVRAAFVATEDRRFYYPHLSNERSLRRKLIELELARRLERTLTKQQILETYLNIIYLGNGTYGVEAASRDLFGKSVGRLSLAEAAAPSRPASAGPTMLRSSISSRTWAARSVRCWSAFSKDFNRGATTSGSRWQKEP